MAFPCNQFGGQEPGTNDEILAFASSHGFPDPTHTEGFRMFAKTHVNGPLTVPVWSFLKNSKVGKGHDIRWNYAKFLVGADGATHQGLYDLAYLRALPNMLVMAPKDENELRHMLRTAVEHPGPAAIRYPRGQGLGVPLDPEIKSLPIGRAELLRDGDDAAIVALGTRVHPALEASAALAARGIHASVLNARFVAPLDATAISELARRSRVLVTVEEHMGQAGFGQRLEHGDPDTYLAAFGLDAAGIEAAVAALLEGASS